MWYKDQNCGLIPISSWQRIMYDRAQNNVIATSSTGCTSSAVDRRCSATRWMACRVEPDRPYTNMRLQSVILNLAGAAWVNQIKAHSEVQMCLFILAGQRAPPRLFGLIYHLDGILSATERCGVVTAAPLCCACGWVFLIFATLFSLGCRFDPVCFATFWLFQSAAKAGAGATKPHLKIKQIRLVVAHWKTVCIITLSVRRKYLSSCEQLFPLVSFCEVDLWWRTWCSEQHKWVDISQQVARNVIKLFVFKGK